MTRENLHNWWWNKRYWAMKNSSGANKGLNTRLFLNKEEDGKEKKVLAEEKEPTIRELEEQLRRKKLKEELAKKATKQSREFDESMLGVCQTCHVPIYQGEPIYTPYDYQSEGTHSGEFGGVSDSPGFGNPGTTAYGGGYRGRDKRHSVSEGWIQCGYCYEEYFKEKKSKYRWDIKHGLYMAGFAIPCCSRGNYLSLFN